MKQRFPKRTYPLPACTWDGRSKARMVEMLLIAYMVGVKFVGDSLKIKSEDNEAKLKTMSRTEDL